VRRRTTINVDTELLDRARAEFGTSGATETIDRALREAIAFQSRIRLTQHDFSGLTLESLEETRRDRSSLSPARQSRAVPRETNIRPAS
jgi:Arc/MetJ family transcription regulator